MGDHEGLMAKSVELAAMPRWASFCAENDASPVVEGVIIHWLESGGARYRLLNGTTWSLTREECRQLPEGYPKWKSP